MKIKLDDTTMLSHDGRQFVLRKFKGIRNTKEKEEIWDALAYTGTIEHALNVYIGVQLEASEAQTIKELISEIKSLRKHLTQLCGGE